jgi:feruloyl esterase
MWMLNANDPDLDVFRARGGKILMYTGWADPIVPPQDVINYYRRVLAVQGGTPAQALARAQEFFRLFMVPGMNHCAFGPGPNAFGNRFSASVVSPPAPVQDATHDVLVALSTWVEQGIAPQSIVATKYVGDQPAFGVQMTRPLCPYPRVARYRGTGDPNDAASFTCVTSTTVEPPLPAPEYRD